MPEALTSIDLKGTLSLRAQGKVRDIYIIGSDQLLFVTTDRISAYDVVLKNVCTTLQFIHHSPY